MGRCKLERRFPLDLLGLAFRRREKQGRGVRRCHSVADGIVGKLVGLCIEFARHMLPRVFWNAPEQRLCLVTVLKQVLSRHFIRPKHLLRHI